MSNKQWRRTMVLSNKQIGTIAILSVIVSVTAGHRASAQETAKDLLAIQIRAQGYSCEKPASAKRDNKLSKADVSVWILRCEHRSYRMRLAPDMAARVQQLK
jgi:hypothetical protein